MRLLSRLADAAPRVGVEHAAALALSTLLCMQTLPPQAALADGDTENFRFPPIDRSKKDRCQFSSSAMGQANAARDSLYDLRECQMADAKAGGFDISGALMAKGVFSGVDFKEAQLSKVYGAEANFDAADFTNGVVDRAYFKGASFRGALFVNTVLSGTTFENADVENADFSEAYIGMFDQRKLCQNPSLKGTNPKTEAPTRESAGCPP